MVKNPEECIRIFCERHEDEMIRLLKELVCIPSESNTENERNAARHIHARLKELQLPARICESDKPYTATSVTFGAAEDGVLLNCPLDTAPAGDLKSWNFHPYQGLINNGRMHGRGTADCKGGIAAMIYALLAIRELQIEESNLRIELVFDGGEHDGSYSGMEYILKTGLNVGGGIIGYAYEGGSNEISIGARGYHRYAFTTHGRTVHSGSRFRKGVNAISAMARFIEELENLPLPRSQSDLFDFGSRLTFSLIEGGRAINMVPDECTAKLDIRTTPEQTKQDAEDLIDLAVLKTRSAYPDFSMDVTYLGGENGYLLRGDESIIHAAKNATADVFEKPAMTIVSGPAHIGNLLYRHKVPIIVQGPHGGNVHAYNEWVELSSIPKCAEFYARTILYYFHLIERRTEERY